MGRGVRLFLLISTMGLSGSLATACAPPVELAVDLHTDLRAGDDYREVRTWLDQRPAPLTFMPDGASRGRVGQRVATYQDLAAGREVATLRLVDAEGDTVGSAERTLDLSAGAQATTLRVFEAPRVLAGWGISCLRLGARLWCWGRLDHFEANRAAGERTGPRELARDVVDVCSSSIETCVLEDDGSLVCTEHAPDEEPSRVIATSHTGHSHEVLTCAGFLLPHRCMLGGDGRVRCGGVDQAGQLGDGPMESTTDHGAHVEVTGLTDVRAIAAGAVHTCALDGAGAVHCWGANSFGQIGDGELGDGAQVPAPFTHALPEIVAVDAFWATTCAIDARGGLHCWGSNEGQQIIVGGDRYEASPVALERVTDVQRVAVGQRHVCVTLAGDTSGVHCWGDNEEGQLGDGTTNARTSPFRVELAGRVIGLDAHVAHTCALTEDDGALALSCWGTNANGELGDPGLERSTTPLRVELPGLHSQ